jgi:apolipoprotein N-acyltransferase
MKRGTLILLALLGGALTALAVPNELFPRGNPALGWLAAAPLYLALAASPGFGFSAALGAVYGAAAHGFSSYWLWFFKDYAVWTLGSTVLAYAVVYAHFALWLSFLLRRGGVWRPLAYALLWAGLEFYKSTGFLGYPWGLLAYSVNEVLPLIQIADRTGVYGISFLLAWSGAALAEIAGIPPGGLGIESRPVLRRFPVPLPADGRDRRALGVGNLALVALTAVIVLSYGYVRLGRPVPEAGRIAAVLVQQNSDSWTDGEERTLLACMDLTRRAVAEGRRRPDIVLWNESNLDAPYAEFFRKYSRYPATDPLVPFFKEAGTRFLLGAPVAVDWETYSFLNAVILVGPDASLEDHYGKIQLVPFAEGVPFWEYEWFRAFMDKVVGLGAGGWTPGAERVLFDLPAAEGRTFRFAAPICFEDAFSGLCRDFARDGADFFVNLTNDSWSRTVSALVQHFAAARFRAVENRRTLVRSTNGGISCVVGAHGEVLAELPVFRAESRFLEIPIYREDRETVYTAYGDWFGWSALFLSGLFALILVLEERISTRRNRREHPRLP